MKASLVMFTIEGERRDFPLRSSVTIVGRMMDCDLRVPVPSVSRNHCQVEARDDELFVRDLQSSNGTYVNNRRVRGATKIEVGDLVSAGPVHFTVLLDGEPKEFAQIRSVLPKTANVQAKDVEAAAKEGTQMAAPSEAVLGGKDVTEPPPASAASAMTLDGFSVGDERAASAATVDADDEPVLLPADDDQPDEDVLAIMSQEEDPDPEVAAIDETAELAPSGDDESGLPDPDAPAKDVAKEAASVATEASAAPSVTREASDDVAIPEVEVSPDPEPTAVEADTSPAIVEAASRSEASVPTEPASPPPAPAAPPVDDGVTVDLTAPQEKQEVDLEAKLSMTGSGLLNMQDEDAGGQSDVAMSAVSGIDGAGDAGASGGGGVNAAADVDEAVVDEEAASALDQLAMEMGGGEGGDDEDEFASMYDEDER